MLHGVNVCVRVRKIYSNGLIRGLLLRAVGRQCRISQMCVLRIEAKRSEGHDCGA